MLDFVNGRGGLGNYINRVRAPLALWQSFLIDVGRFDFARNGNQFGTAANGDLVLSTQDVSAHISGEGVLLEDPRTNLIQGSSVIDSAGSDWVGAELGTATPTVAVTDPTGGLNASLVDLSGGVNARISALVNGVGSGATQTYNIWLRSVTGSGTYPITVLNSTLGHQMFQVSLTTAWKRFPITTINGTAQLFVYVGNRRDGPASTLNQAYVFNPQSELSEFGSSDILTSAGSTASRSATSQTLPFPFNANGISTQIQPTVQFDATDDKVTDALIFDFSDGTENNYFRATYDQVNDQIHLKKRVSAGTEVVASTSASALNYVFGQKLNIRARAGTDGISLWVDSLPKVTVSTGDATTDWSTTLTTIEINPSFQAVELIRVANEARSDAFLGNLT